MESKLNKTNETLTDIEPKSIEEGIQNGTLRNLYPNDTVILYILAYLEQRYSISSFDLRVP